VKKKKKKKNHEKVIKTRENKNLSSLDKAKTSIAKYEQDSTALLT
jgi:hypothetical protein